MLITDNRLRALALALTGGALLSGATPALAQSGDADTRLRKVEAEVRALQRKVFPDGAGKTFAPEISTAQQSVQPIGAPSSTAVTDILARLDAIEGQLRQLTAGNEENANGLRLLQDRVRILESGASTGAGATVPQMAPTPSPALAQAVPPAVATKTTPVPAPKPSGPTAERLAAVQAVAKPATGDAGDDDYSYGFRLWDAKLYPEAIQQLTLFIEKYPGHPQISYGRNLLGRAYLDNGKPREAAPWFLKNYQSDKLGARAGDSLLYLGESMIALGDTKRACIALAEFSETYPALASGRLKAQYEASRKQAKCS